MKKIIIILVSLALIFAAVFGITEFRSETIQDSETASIAQTQLSTADETEIKEDNSTSKANKRINKTTEKKASTTSEAASKAKETVTSENKSKAKPSEKTSAKKRAETTKATVSTTKSENICYITIECKAILGNMDKLKEGHDEFVPKNGIILSKTEYRFKDKETAFDILKQACDENEIKLTARSTQYGTYVSGINNLDEFDCGKSSGWLYKINSKTPGISCGKYKLSPGDEITFSYTV